MSWCHLSTVTTHTWDNGRQNGMRVGYEHVHMLTHQHWQTYWDRVRIENCYFYVYIIHTLNFSNDDKIQDLTGIRTQDLLNTSQSLLPLSHPGRGAEDELHKQHCLSKFQLILTLSAWDLTLSRKTLEIHDTPLRVLLEIQLSNGYSYQCYSSMCTHKWLDSVVAHLCLFTLTWTCWQGYLLQEVVFPDLTWQLRTRVKLSFYDVLVAMVTEFFLSLLRRIEGLRDHSEVSRINDWIYFRW